MSLSLAFTLSTALLVDGHPPPCSCCISTKVRTAALLDEPVQAAPSLAEPLVRAGLLAVLDRVLLEERRPPGAPFVVFQQPRRGGDGVLGVLELVGDSQELDSGLQPGLQRRAPLDMVGRVERAPLYPGVRPDGLDGGGEAGRAVGYRHLRGRDAQHERDADPHSLCARCQPTTWPPATATSTAAFLRSQMPSRNATSCSSPVAEAIGQILQAHAVLRQNVALLVFRSAIASFDSSHLRNAASCFAPLSCLRTLDAPHLGQRHLWVPALVLPFPFILAPQEPHFGLFTPRSRLLAISWMEKPV